LKTIQSQFAAAVAECDRIEAQVWERTMIGEPVPGDREPYVDALAELMTQEEHAKWRSIRVVIDEMAKHLTRT
jgi:hypothetical protein